jgi:hypothetical protein
MAQGRAARNQRTRRPSRPHRRQRARCRVRSSHCRSPLLPVLVFGRLSTTSSRPMEGRPVAATAMSSRISTVSTNWSLGWSNSGCETRSRISLWLGITKQRSPTRRRRELSHSTHRFRGPHQCPIHVEDWDGTIRPLGLLPSRPSRSWHRTSSPTECFPSSCVGAEEENVEANCSRQSRGSFLAAPSSDSASQWRLVVGATTNQATLAE